MQSQLNRAKLYIPIALRAYHSPVIARCYSTNTTPDERQQARSRRLAQLRLKFFTPPLTASTTKMSFQPLYKYIDRDTLAEQVRKYSADPNQREVAIIDVRGASTTPDAFNLLRCLADSLPLTFADVHGRRRL